MENLELEEQRVWKHELRGTHPFLFSFFFFFGFGFGFSFGGHHRQLSTKANSLFLGGFVASRSGWAPSPNFNIKSSSLIFFLFFLCFVACGCKCVPSLTLNKEGAQAPFFCPFLLLRLGVGGLHY